MGKQMFIVFTQPCALFGLCSVRTLFSPTWPLSVCIKVQRSKNIIPFLYGEREHWHKLVAPNKVESEEESNYAGFVFPKWRGDSYQSDHMSIFFHIHFLCRLSFDSYLTRAASLFCVFSFFTWTGHIWMLIVWLVYPTPSGTLPDGMCLTCCKP